MNKLLLYFLLFSKISCHASRPFTFTMGRGLNLADGFLHCVPNIKEMSIVFIKQNSDV
jgi:hypothetical protein